MQRRSLLRPGSAGRVGAGGRAGYAIMKAGAGGINVHRRRLVRPQSGLQARSRVRHVLVKTATAVDDKVEFVGFHAGARPGPRGRDQGHFLTGDVGDTPFLPAGAADDPFFVGRQERGEVRIGEIGGRPKLAPTGERIINHIDFHCILLASGETDIATKARPKRARLVRNSGLFCRRSSIRGEATKVKKFAELLGFELKVRVVSSAMWGNFEFCGRATNLDFVGCRRVWDARGGMILV